MKLSQVQAVLLAAGEIEATSVHDAIEMQALASRKQLMESMGNLIGWANFVKQKMEAKS